MGSSAAEATLAIIVCGVGGLVVGSFLNVVVYRWPRGESLLRPPSRCPTCETRLTSLDLVPVFSWVALRGRCRHCGAAVSGRYPVVELATGAAFAGSAAAIGPSWQLAPVEVLVACTLVAAVLDADGARTPVALAVCACATTVCLASITAGLGEPGRIGWAALGAALTGAAALAVERTRGTHRFRRIAVLAALGATAGLFWPGGGPFAAAWVVVATAATVVSATRRPPLAVLVAGAYAAVVASAAIGHP